MTLHYNLTLKRVFAILLIALIILINTLMLYASSSDPAGPAKWRWRPLIDGIQINIHDSSRRGLPLTGSCTIGYTAVRVSDSKMGIVTASHCLYNGTDEGYSRVAFQPEYSSDNYVGYPFIIRSDLDTVFISTNINLTYDPNVLYIWEYMGSYYASRYYVVGYFSRAELETLPNGTYVCKTGKTTGTTCRAFFSAKYECILLFYPDFRSKTVCGLIIRTSNMSYHGDSGSPLFRQVKCYGRGYDCDVKLLGHLMGGPILGGNVNIWISVADVVNNMGVVPLMTSPRG